MTCLSLSVIDGHKYRGQAFFVEVLTVRHSSLQAVGEAIQRPSAASYKATGLFRCARKDGVTLDYLNDD